MALVNAVIHPLAVLTLEEVQEKYPPQRGLSDGLLTVSIPLSILCLAFPAELEYYDTHKCHKVKAAPICVCRNFHVITLYIGHVGLRYTCHSALW